MMKNEAPLIGISRHRIATDGVGVTTLVTFHGCPLRCRYCLNPQCLRPSGLWKTVTLEDLLEEVRIDDLYFQATGGGITFGGGEPLLRSGFIRAFCELVCSSLSEGGDGGAWNITLETSLHVPRKHLEEVLPYVNEYFVDVKDMNPDIYRRYTCRSNRQTLHNLQWLAEQGLQEHVIIRLPRIPDYNNGWDVRRSRKTLEQMGYTRFDCFTYIKDVEGHKRKIR